MSLLSRLLKRTPADNPEAQLDNCLSLDIEASEADRRINKLAGVRPDTGESVIFDARSGPLDEALDRLDAIAEGAAFVLGHNLIRFDLPLLRSVQPTLRLLDLPAVDTLMLNPLAFPRNPYHYLVKHYQDGQLRRGSVNDPKLDADLTLELFGDQQKAFEERVDSDSMVAWHWLTTGEGLEGFDMVFRSLRGAPRPSRDDAEKAVLSRLGETACVKSAEEVLGDVDRQGWALAYVLAWLSVAGGNSVMPPWVRYQFPETGDMVNRLRATPCDDQRCVWCIGRHDARGELKRWFGFDDFRSAPAGADGRPLQQSVVESVMRDEPTLAILPTGTGKSICYQVPALSRYSQTGGLTVVISPLVALMADQVAGLERRGIFSAVTANSLLSMPERGDALDKVRFGDAAILIISPEQLRSASIADVLRQRDIAYWVLDEAHCLSKWGHDFRPDYRYVGRFIRERAGENPIPPVLCLTATAKPDVATDITEYFADELGVRLELFDGGAHRSNLEFAVVKTSEGEKFEHTYQVVEADLLSNGEGGAIVYCSTQRRTEEMARFLQEKGVSSTFYHGGLSPEVKKEAQESFFNGDVRVMVATNAFGMGIDKPDVRLVAHADIPGSLENYMQEAGRAGRDSETARCVLLYTPEDMERQFKLAARSRLSRREIQGVLKALRNIERRDKKNQQGGEVVATSGEILREERDGDWERDSTTDDTRVKSAVSWLEDSMLLTREQNNVRMFPASLRVTSLKEAQSKCSAGKVAGAYRGQLMALVRTLLEADADEGVSTDDLMMRAGLGARETRKALRDLEDLGIVADDTAITAFVHAGVPRSSGARFEQAAALENATLDLMREITPDMEVGSSSPLYLRRLTQRLKGDGHSYALPERVRRIIYSIAADGRGEAGVGGSLGVQGRGPDSLHVTLRRGWGSLWRVAETRRDAAACLLRHLQAVLPRGARGVDLLAETTLGKLKAAVKGDMVLASKVRDHGRLMERALLWLHEQEIIRLNKGLTVFRSAMTVRLAKENRRFTNADFTPLSAHYDEQTLQVHIMDRYAQMGLDSMAGALRLVMDYFVLSQGDFLNRWLPAKQHELTRQTTRESWHRVVDSLRNAQQRRIVVDDRENPTVLVLAGPGSGKTRALVHRIAYLIRVRRESAGSILALAYNRHAAVEIRLRLGDLIGEDARGVVVLTCHALAMRLTGTSFRGRANRLKQPDFKGVLKEAAALLEGDGMEPEEADDFRDRLLAGFRWILIDEYQDIDAEQYALISALAGRKRPNADDKLSLFAVGDDDQNIYAFAGASVEFVRRFEMDYSAQSLLLTQNYRSTKHIIEAANAVIAPARERMKADAPIEVNSQRAGDLEGGDWALTDPVGRGQVQIISVGETPTAQGQAIVAELKRLAELDPEWDWASCAVVARNWRFLDPVRAICEMEGIPVQMANEEFSGIWFLRETRALRDWLATRESRVVSSTDISEFLSGLRPGPWVEALGEGVSEYEEETGGAENPVDHFVEWLAEWGQNVRRRQNGVLLLTAHRVKGLEFDHVVVLDGNWESISKGEDPDAPRRLYYVAMTRARKTLTLGRMPGPNPYQDALLTSPAVLLRNEARQLPTAPTGASRVYTHLSLRDVFLSYAGYRGSGDPIHKEIAALHPGDRLEVQAQPNGRWALLNEGGLVVGQLAGSWRVPGGMTLQFASVMAVVVWEKANSEPEYQKRLKCDRWEVVIPTLILEPADVQGNAG